MLVMSICDVRLQYKTVQINRIDSYPMDCYHLRNVYFANLYYYHLIGKLLFNYFLEILLNII
jgi:hypothetical protein